MTTERIVGFILLVVGLGVIAYALYSSFVIFTGEEQAPELFSENPIKPQPSTSSGDVNEQLENLFQQQLEGLLPSDTIPRVLNMSMWSLFVGLLLFGGGQIAGIGIKLLSVRRREDGEVRS